MCIFQNLKKDENLKKDQNLKHFCSQALWIKATQRVWCVVAVSSQEKLKEALSVQNIPYS
jgi:hypothetical protein